MNIILQILGIACFSVLFAEASGIMFYVKKWLGIICFQLKLSDTLFIGRLKPFDCPMCLSWWIGLFAFAYTGPMAILYASICSIASIVISKTINKL